MHNQSSTNFYIALLSSLLLLVACDRKAEQDTPVAAAPDTAEVAPPTTLPRTASPEGASVFFFSPTDGATVKNPVSIQFGISGMSVVKAGDSAPDSGHHHLLIDTGMPDPALPIPADARHVHFGDGSTETEITLEPGEHTLRLLLGDHLHIPHDPPVMSEPLTITVE